MDPTVTSSIAEQAPWAAVVLILIGLFLSYMSKQEDKRIAHEKSMQEARTLAEKERDQAEREHKMLIANMDAQSMKALIDKIEQMMNAVIENLGDHEEASRERYKNMGITKDLLIEAKSQLGKKR